MYTVKREKACTSLDGNGNIKTCYLMHITVDTIADIPDAKENWLAGSRCDVLEDGGHVYELSNGREWVEVNFFDRVSDGDSTDLSNFYTKSQTDERITEKVAEIVADAPEDFDTLKELSDWISSHEDSAAAMNSAIADNTAAIANKVDKVPGKVLSTNDFTDADKNKLDELENYDDTYIKSEIALNHITLGYQMKNLLKISSRFKGTKLGVTVTQQSDGKLIVAGTNTEAYTNYIFQKSYDNYTIENGKSLFIKGAEIISNCEYIVGITTATGTNNWIHIPQNGLILSGDVTIRTIYVQQLTAGTEIYAEIYPLVQLADIADGTYEPYRPSVAEYIENLEARISALENNQISE